MRKNGTRLLFAALLVAVVAAGGAFGVIRWRDGVRADRDVARLAAARELLAQDRADAALEAFRVAQSAGFLSSESRGYWNALKLECLVALHLGPQMAAQYETQPELFETHERAAILLIAWLDANRHQEQSRKLRQSWAGRESFAADWLILDAERLIRDGYRKEAATLLGEQTFTGEDEGRRLLRLALLQDTPQTTAKVLNEALTAAPQSAAVRRARAQFMERSGELRAAAFEYSLALGLDISPDLVEEVAEFFVRQGSLESAVSVWEDGSARSLLPRLRALDWGRLLRPVQSTDAPLPQVDEGPARLIRQMSQLPEGRFWGESLDKATLGLEAGESLDAELNLLRLLEALRTGDLAAAETHRMAIPVGTLPLPGLEEALRNLLWLKLGKPGAFREPVPGAHPFARSGNELVRPTADGARLADLPDDSFGKLLRGRDCWAALMLSAGLREAALLLSPEVDLAAGYPEWFYLDYAMALAANRSPAEALTFVDAMPSTAESRLLAGQLQYAIADRESARKTLAPLAAQADKIGSSAARLLAVDWLEKGELANAASVLDGNQALSESVAGKELRARLELALGHADVADSLMESIARSSANAQQYLAMRALARKDWKSAEMHARFLVSAFPERSDYRALWVKVARKLKEDA